MQLVLKTLTCNAKQNLCLSLVTTAHGCRGQGCGADHPHQLWEKAEPACMKVQHCRRRWIAQHPALQLVLFARQGRQHALGLPTVPKLGIGRPEIHAKLRLVVRMTTFKQTLGRIDIGVCRSSSFDENSRFETQFGCLAVCPHSALSHHVELTSGASFGWRAQYNPCSEAAH